MVLKKSNSSLNSGATQHISRGGFLNPRKPWYFAKRTAGVLEVSVQPSTLDADADVDACLSMINDYLGWEGPRFSQRRDRAFNHTRFHVVSQWRRESQLSLSKGGNWNLRQRLCDLLNDIDFLKLLPEHVDVNVTEKFEPLVKTGLGGQIVTKTKTSSQILKAFETAEKTMEKQTKRLEKRPRTVRRRQKYHGRGVQRRCVATSKVITDTIDGEEDHAPERKSSLNFTFHEPCEVDARSSKLCELRENRLSSKSYFKRKGYVHGMRSSNRKRAFQIQEELCDEVLGVSDRKFTSTVKESENGETCAQVRSSYSLEDFILPVKAARTRHKSRKNHSSLISEEESSVCDRIRHPKGSYICHHPGTSSLFESSWEVIDHFDFHNSKAKEGGSLADKDENSSMSENECRLVDNTLSNGDEPISAPMASEHARAVERQFKQFTDSFIKVQALMPGDGISLFPEAMDKLHVGGRPNITTGHCLPHCFCVSREKSSGDSYVVGRRASRDGKTWLLSLQGKTSAHQANDFQDKLYELGQYEDPVSLTQVISMAEELLKQDTLSDKKFSKNSVFKAPEGQRVKYRIWQDLSTLAGQEVSILCPEEVAEVITLPDKISDHADAKKETNASNTGSVIPYDDFECEICFSLCNIYGNAYAEPAMMLLPCRHAHCVNCWKAHAYHSIESGAPKISCMTHGCGVLMDETTLRTLLPHAFVTSWQTKLRNRCLQTSDFTSWCPDGQCGRVAISSKVPLKKQFGSPLMCLCRRCWCSNCLEDPHWPASCDQAAVYKQLLAKTGNKSTMAVAHATYNVDVKKCPNCKYPIEKNQGCPFMVCGMCWFHFCWNCLQSTTNHNVYACKVSPSSHLVTYSVQNKLVYDLPIKFFMESIKANDQISLLERSVSWLEKLQINLTSKFACRLRLPTKLSCVTSSENVVDTSLYLIDKTLLFLRKAFTLTETFYILLSFVQLHKKKSSVSLVSCIANKMSRLHFTTERLSSHVVGKSLPHVFSVQQEVRILLKSGEAILKEMSLHVPVLQERSKDVDTTWVANIDPSKHLRYM